ncbi:minor capsid protein [Streptomyces sp. URMC 129]|uniref:minor capsid protein n=1 Tax=Streptomyces sp. URMC 129 TaxID=3423407 RepID=UPI003F1A4634
MPQYTRFEWEGRRLWTGRGKRAAALGMRRALEHLLAESRKLVPLDEGTLERSSRVVMDDDGLEGTVVYDTPYAVVQHEDLTYKHLPGRQAKYLEQPSATERPVMLELMRAEVRRRWLRGG